jgi:hypothetical protein
VVSYTRKRLLAIHLLTLVAPNPQKAPARAPERDQKRGEDGGGTPTDTSAVSYCAFAETLGALDAVKRNQSPHRSWSRIERGWLQRGISPLAFETVLLHKWTSEDALCLWRCCVNWLRKCCQ